jgi:UDP-2-acetamido-3-amino-2,3-dideoxy-glucuronate N-acetyltransferase
VFTNVENPRAAVPRKHAYKPTRVRRGATLGANCTIVCGVTIGRWAFVGAGAVVSADVPDFALVVGVPARQIGWVGRAGRRLVQDSLSDSGERTWKCPETGALYRETSSGLTEA